MDTSHSDTYTAKLIDGPLEGKTVSISFPGSGTPQPRIELTATEGKKYVYFRTEGTEFAAEGDERPSAVDYRFLETVFS